MDTSNSYEEDEVGQNGEEEEYNDVVELEDEAEKEEDDDEDVADEEEEDPWTRIISWQSHRMTRVKTGGVDSRISGNRRFTRSGHSKGWQFPLPIYRKELRNIFLEYLEWMHAMKNDPIVCKVMETRRDLMAEEGY